MSHSRRCQNHDQEQKTTPTYVGVGVAVGIGFVVAVVVGIGVAVAVGVGVAVVVTVVVAVGVGVGVAVAVVVAVGAGVTMPKLLFILFFHQADDWKGRWTSGEQVRGYHLGVEAGRSIITACRTSLGMMKDSEWRALEKEPAEGSCCEACSRACQTTKAGSFRARYFNKARLKFRKTSAKGELKDDGSIDTYSDRQQNLHRG